MNKVSCRWVAPDVIGRESTRGDYAIVRPIPPDTVAALRGAHAGPGPSTEVARALDRADDTGRPGKPR